MPKFSLQRIVDAKRETVFETFSNFENYSKLFPQHFPSIRVRSVRNNVSVVEEYLNLGDKEFLIMAKHVSDAPTSHDVFVIGGDAKGSVFKEKFLELENGTKIIVEVDLKIKGKLKISSLFGKNNYEQDYGKILDDFVKIVEN
ncbi:SRPBCC family protein [Nitrosopumilus ureiphilus]|uniref:Polyketide cyclase n=1 Tax=Nitrosopumilus ureiphilus TaxID=1470067 RepID=A0A7D5R313_9ARCH|nr:SRPBCC family protein [Nitrosopumilus ureiphilus]QLH06640.1 polyketide cyclase [Nitrosopumilus ureiphilus]